MKASGFACPLHATAGRGAWLEYLPTRAARLSERVARCLPCAHPSDGIG